MATSKAFAFLLLNVLVIVITLQLVFEMKVATAAAARDTNIAAHKSGDLHAHKSRRVPNKLATRKSLNFVAVAVKSRPRLAAEKTTKQQLDQANNTSSTGHALVPGTIKQLQKPTAAETTGNQNADAKYPGDGYGGPYPYADGYGGYPGGGYPAVGYPGPRYSGYTGGGYPNPNGGYPGYGGGGGYPRDPYAGGYPGGGNPYDGYPGGYPGGGGGGPGPGYGGYRDPGGYPGRNIPPGGAGYGGYTYPNPCRYGCCGGEYNNGCSCCSYPGEAADKNVKKKTHS
ncbi:hypothetical protein Dimus_009733 [Dionaea muscipula]